MKYPSSDPVEVPLGSNVTLRCAASGHPNPSIHWYDSTGKVLGAGLSVQVKAEREAVGQLVICVADNGVGKAANGTFNIMAVCKYKSEIKTGFWEWVG